MEIQEMEKVIQDFRTEFRKALENGADYMREEIRSVITKALDKCCGEFDEQCLLENMREEFIDYLNISQERGE